MDGLVFASGSSYCYVFAAPIANCNVRAAREVAPRRHSLQLSRVADIDDGGGRYRISPNPEPIVHQETDANPVGVERQAPASTEPWGKSLRRPLLALPLAAATAAVATLALAPPAPSIAAVKNDNRAPSENSFLRTLGIGERDVYYPRFFEGTWLCYSTLIAVETPQGDDKADKQSVEQSRKRLGYTSKQTTYEARFLPFEGYIICDRLFTTVSLVESIIGKNTVDHGTWSPRQPNRLQLILKGGAKVENTVTKRSAGMFSPYEFESAEFSKQVLDNFSTKDGPPTVKASQNLTRYQWDVTANDVSKIEAIQKVSMFPVPKEGVAFDGLDFLKSTSPITIYKYKLTFKRE